MRSSVKRRAEIVRSASGIVMEELENRVMMSVTTLVTPALQNPIIPVPPLPIAPEPLQGVVGTPLSLDPQEMRRIYNFDAIFYKDDGNVVVGDGAGETIAIVDPYGSPSITSDLQTFDAHWGLSDLDAAGQFALSVQTLAPTVNTIIDDPATIAGWSEETALDVEWAHVVAPKAHILLVEAPSATILDGMDADVFAAAQPGVVVVSQSFGVADGALTEPQLYDGFMVTPTGHLDNNGIAGNVVFVASSGDTSNPLEYPSASPSDIGVGGLTEGSDINGNSTTFGAWSMSGGGGTVPLVALDADPHSGAWTYNSTPVDGVSGWQVVGGTSLAAPMFSAYVAVIDEGLALQDVGSLDTGTLTNDILIDNQLSQTQAANTFRDVGGTKPFAAYPLWGKPPAAQGPQAGLIPSNGHTGYGAPIGPTFAASVVDFQGDNTPLITGQLGLDIVSSGDGLDDFVFTPQPATFTAGALTPVVVDADFAGTTNVDTNFNGVVTISLASGPAGGALTGTLTATAVNGVATFSNLHLTELGIYSFNAANPTALSGLSALFSVNAAALHELDLPLQPINAWQFGIQTTSVIALVDSFGNLRTEDNSIVTVSIASGPTGATLSGSTSVNANGGYAFFRNLSFNVPGTYTLTYTSNGVSVTSNAFTIVGIPVTRTFTLNGARLSPATLLLQQQRNAAIFTSSGPPPAALVQQQQAAGNSVIVGSTVAAVNFSSALIVPTGKMMGTSAFEQLLG